MESLLSPFIRPFTLRCSETCDAFGMLFLGSLFTGATVVLLPRIEPLTVLQAFARHRCSHTLGLPTIFNAVAQAQTDSPHDVSSGRFYFCGGDSVSPSLQEAFERAMGRSVCEGYGCTEATPLTYNRPGCIRVGSMGQGAEGVVIRLLDSDGQDIAPGEVGRFASEARS